MYRGGRRYRGRKPKVSGIIFPLIVIIFIALSAVVLRYIMGSLNAPQEQDNFAEADSTENIYIRLTEEDTTEEIFDDEHYMSLIDMTRIYSRNIYMTRASDERVILSILGDERIYPASMTKIMTALICVDNISDMDEEIVVPASIFPYLIEENASVAGFLEDEKVKAKDLLYGVMLPSGADACLAFAIKIAGSEEGFAELMNVKAEEIGLTDTHFVTSTGLHDIDHYSTPKDMAKLLAYAIKNETVYNLLTTETYYTSPTEKNPDGIKMTSTMFKNLENAELSNGRILGGKTGYTNEAGYCLASFAELDGEKYILITAGAQSEEPLKSMSQLDAVYLYESDAVKPVD